LDNGRVETGVKRMKNPRPLQLAVLQVLDTAHRSMVGDWSVQGFGVLRLYIRKIGRLHLWDRALQYPGVSLVHNHSWDLRSTIVCGRIVNTRFEETESAIGHPYHGRRLLTGYQSRFVQNEFITTLLNQPREAYIAGDVYKQSAHEIHVTDPDDGTITLMERNEDTNGEANVYWPYGTEWGDAKPRPATADEIQSTIAKCTAALEKELSS
jgi:hypothetical protein